MTKRDWILCKKIPWQPTLKWYGCVGMDKAHLLWLFTFLDHVLSSALFLVFFHITWVRSCDLWGYGSIQLPVQNQVSATKWLSPTLLHSQWSIALYLVVKFARFIQFLFFLCFCLNRYQRIQKKNDHHTSWARRATRDCNSFSSPKTIGRPSSLILIFTSFLFCPPICPPHARSPTLTPFHTKLQTWCWTMGQPRAQVYGTVTEAVYGIAKSLASKKNGQFYFA